MNILKKADEIVNDRSEEKEREYGPFGLCNERAAKIASVLCDKEITPIDIYHFQIALKFAREAHSHKEDNLLDAVAYIGALNNYHNGVEPTSKEISVGNYSKIIKEKEIFDVKKNIKAIIDLLNAMDKKL